MTPSITIRPAETSDRRMPVHEYPQAGLECLRCPVPGDCHPSHQDCIADTDMYRNRRVGRARILSADVVHRIRQSAQSSAYWARRLGVSRQAVSDARRGRTWGEITEATA